MAEQNREVIPKLTTAGFVGVAAVIGAPAGAFAANELFPPTIEYAPGFKAVVNFAVNKGLNMDGVVTTLNAPNVPLQAPFPWHGLHARIVELNPSGNHGALHDLYPALITKFQRLVIEPTRFTLIHHLEKGAVAGAIGAGALAYLGLRSKHKIQKHEEVRRSRIAELYESSVITDTSLNKKLADELAEELNYKRQRRNILGKIAVAAATFSMMGMGIGGEGGSNVRETQSRSDMPEVVALSPVITQRIPELKGATLTGLAGKLVRTAADQGAVIANNIDTSLQKDAQTFETAYEKYEIGPGLPYVNNPNLESVVEVSDLHCNYANYQYYFQALMQRLKPQIIVNAGDTFTNSGTMPYEKDCFTGFVDAVSVGVRANNLPVTIINVAGNHDPKKPYNFTRGYVKVVSLTSRNPSYIVDGLTFVGAEDAADTVWSTQPDTYLALNKAIESEANIIADAACKVTDKSGEAPIVVSHRWQTSFETIYRGCASLVLNGHTHTDGPVQSFIGSNGRIVLQHTAGSASGTKVGFTIYETPKQDSTETLQYINKTTHQVEAFVSPKLHKDGTLTIKIEDIPSRSQSVSDSPEMNTFLSTFSQDYNKQP